MKIRIKDLFFFVTAYMELVVCFLYSYMDATLRGASSIIVCMLLCLIYLFGTKKSIKKNGINIFVWVCICLFFVVWRNYDINNGYYGRFFYMLMSFSFITMMSGTVNWCYHIVKYIKWISATVVIVIIYQKMVGGAISDGNLFIHCEVLLSISIAGLCVGDKRKTINFISIAIALVAILLTGKTGPPLFHLCAIVTILYIAFFQKSKRRNAVVIILYTLIAVLLFSSSFEFSDGINNVIGEYYTDNFSNGRVTLYNRAIDIFLRSPWVGIGMGGYREYSHILGYEVHNIYLQLLCEIGIIGTAVFIGLFIFLLGRTIKMIRFYENDKNALRLIYISLYGQIYFLLYGLTGNPLYDFNFILYGFFAAIAVSLSLNNLNWRVNNGSIKKKRGVKVQSRHADIPSIR